jgi:hypothetical protein
VPPAASRSSRRYRSRMIRSLFMLARSAGSDGSA